MLALLAFAAIGWANALPVNNFVLSNLNADGSFQIPSASYPSNTQSFDLTGGNNGTGVAGETDFLWDAPSDITVNFQWTYVPARSSILRCGTDSCDDPTFDWAGYIVGGIRTQLTDIDTSGILATANFHVAAGQSFGWYVGTFDNLGEPATLTIVSPTFDAAVTTAPEPASWMLLAAALICLLGFRFRHSNWRRSLRLSLTLVPCVAAFGQVQNSYNGSVVTGQLHYLTTTNLTQLSAAAPSSNQIIAQTAGPEIPKLRQAMPLPPPRRGTQFQVAGGNIQAGVQSLAVVPSTLLGTGFDGMTHRDQRLANNGNQFSVEPPNPSIAAANGKILEGVNNAVRVFSSTGTALTATITSNQLFGLAPAINRATNVSGVFTTDMRVFFDSEVSRWMVLQRSQDEDADGNALSQSHIYLAVSKTADPAGDYNVYIMDTTNSSNPGCPCVDDFPQIGADHYGFYISSNEYSLFDPNNPFFNDANILAISKADLASGVLTPTAVRFIMPSFTNFEFSIQPATTPPGGSPMVASGGVEFFVSSYPNGFDFNLALWALSNTASLQSASPSLLLTQTFVPTLTYSPPPFAVPQKPGPLTLGTSLETLDAGYFSDSRVLSTSYAGGRLYVTLASAVNNAAGGLYTVFSPTLRSGVLSASKPVKQGFVSATGNHILRPAIAVNALGQGVIAFTLVGNAYYPTSAFVSFDLTPSTPSVVQIAATGALPEDGFTGYGPSAACPTCSGFGIARWGDYSTAVASSDGSIWFVNEYIPNAPRTPLANWGTFISKFLP